MLTQREDAAAGVSDAARLRSRFLAFANTATAAHVVNATNTPTTGTSRAANSDGAPPPPQGPLTLSRSGFKALARELLFDADHPQPPTDRDLDAAFLIADEVKFSYLGYYK